MCNSEYTRERKIQKCILKNSKDKKKREDNQISNLIGTFEAGGDHFGDAVHGIFRLLDDGIHLGKCGGLPNRRIFNRKLKLLDIGWDLVHVFQQLFFQ